LEHTSWSSWTFAQVGGLFAFVFVVRRQHHRRLRPGFLSQPRLVAEEADSDSDTEQQLQQSVTDIIAGSHL
jgi:hypothetical protein